MCYFFSLAEEEIRLQQRYNAEYEIRGKLEKRKLINGFTFPETPVLTNEFPNLFRFFNWGLIPEWVKSKEEALNIRKNTLNARIETMFTKPSFASCAKYRRCLVPVNGFYEWQHRGKNKIKYHITLINQDIFSLGGIWSEWIDRETGEIFRTFSIVTMPANHLMERIHNSKKRMPVILPKEWEFEWIRNDLNKNNIHELAHRCSEERLNAVIMD